MQGGGSPPKRRRPATPTTHEEWKAYKRNFVLSTRGQQGRHQSDYNAMSRFYLSKGEYEGNGFVESLLRTHAANRNDESKVRLDGSEHERAEETARLRLEAASTARDVVDKGKMRDVALEKQVELFATLRMQLTHCIKEHGLDATEAESVFFNLPGKTAVHWNADRELNHRNEVRQKKRTGSLAEHDPVTSKFANFMLPNGSEIPIATFISCDVVQWTRPSKQGGGQAGRSGYTTVLAVTKNGYSAGTRTPATMQPVFGNCRFGAKPVAWVPFSRCLVEALEPAFAAYFAWKSFENGEYKRVASEYRSVVRAGAIAMDLVQSRNERVREQHVRQDADGAAAAVEKPVDLVELNRISRPRESATSEELMVYEELEALQQIWQTFGLVVAGLCDDDIDLHYEIIGDLVHTNAMVISYECHYHAPSELSYRNMVEDTMSYADSSTLRAIHDGLFEDIEPVSHQASSGCAPYQEYAVDGQVYRVYPYAAVLNPETMQLQVDFSVMRRCHPDVYSSVSYRLKNWHYEGMASGGFSNVLSCERRRSASQGSAGQREHLALAEPRPTINGLATQHKKWRYRRVTGEEKGLPATDYSFVSEYKSISSCGEETWLVWTGGAFYAEVAGESPRGWVRLPQNKHGDFKPVGWESAIVD